jgi:hypothetical protein
MSRINMSSTFLHDSKDSLLESTPKLEDGSSTKPLSSTSQTIIKTLSVIRIATGVACLLAPRFTCALFKYNVPVEQSLIVRMVGGRDAMLGAILITAEDKNQADGGRRWVSGVLLRGRKSWQLVEKSVAHFGRVLLLMF